ncbi:MAG: glycosyltransferase [Clostridiaceae bacterium]|nr:glycosyltransferase [Clostridiaceae bacterium]
MKVMILSVTAGFGHHATAKAVSDELVSHGAEVRTLDVYEYINRVVKGTIDKGYLFSSKHTKELYRLVYALAENRGTAYFTTPISILNIVNALGASKFARIVTDFNPDVLVCTHVFAAQVVNEIKKRGLLTTTTVGIITDYTIHPYWEDVPYIEYIVTASELLHHRSLKRGIEANRLLHFGIPIHPKFNHTIPREEACAALGIDPNRPTILMMGGSMGYSNNKKLIQSLSTIGIDFQLLVVCGNNKRQYRELTRTLETSDGTCTVLPYGFVNNVEVMMSAADCIITKPGGLTVSEALAKNLPMILVDPIPGHEERNVEFLMNNGMAMLVTKTFPVDEAVYHLFTNPARLQSMRETMHAIAHPDATERLCKFILDMPQAIRS